MPVMMTFLNYTKKELVYDPCKCYPKWTNIHSYDSKCHARLLLHLMMNQWQIDHVGCASDLCDDVLAIIADPEKQGWIDKTKEYWNDYCDRNNYQCTGPYLSKDPREEEISSKVAKYGSSVELKPRKD